MAVATAKSPRSEYAGWARSVSSKYTVRSLSQYPRSRSPVTQSGAVRSKPLISGSPNCLPKAAGKPDAQNVGRVRPTDVQRVGVGRVAADVAAVLHGELGGGEHTVGAEVVAAGVDAAVEALGDRRDPV